MSLFLMMRLALFTGLVTITLLTAKIPFNGAFAADSDVLSLQLGDTIVQIVVTERSPGGLTLVSVHAKWREASGIEIPATASRELQAGRDTLRR